jgi:ubiquinone/menaquinone biosynthesis C-methylase UbiE
MHAHTSDTDALDRVAGFWSERADGYNQRSPEILEQERAAWSGALRALLPAPPGALLDLGTGPGDVAWLCAALGWRATGIDRAEGMLRVARANAPPPPPAQPPTYQLGHAQALLVPPASFDVVISRFLLWTLLSPKTALANWLTVLRPGGRMIAVECLWWVREMRNPETGALPFDHRQMVTRYGEIVSAALPVTTLDSLTQIEALATDVGFENVSVGRLETLERALWPVMDARGEGRYPIHVLVAEKPL